MIKTTYFYIYNSKFVDGVGSDTSDTVKLSFEDSFKVVSGVDAGSHFRSTLKTILKLSVNVINPRQRSPFLHVVRTPG